MKDRRRFPSWTKGEKNISTVLPRTEDEELNSHSKNTSRSCSERGMQEFCGCLLKHLLCFDTQNVPLGPSSIAGKQLSFFKYPNKIFSSSVCFLSGTLLLTLQLRTEISFTIFSSALSPNASNGFEKRLGTQLPQKKKKVHSYPRRNGSINGVCRQVHWQSVNKSWGIPEVWSNLLVRYGNNFDRVPFSHRLHKKLGELERKRWQMGSL